MIGERCSSGDARDVRSEPSGRRVWGKRPGQPTEVFYFSGEFMKRILGHLRRAAEWISTKAKMIGSRLSRNFWMKLLSFLLAILLWNYVISSNSSMLRSVFASDSLYSPGYKSHRTPAHTANKNIFFHKCFFMPFSSFLRKVISLLLLPEVEIN